MDRFPLPLQVQQDCDGSPWVLINDFSYIDPGHGLIAVEAGFDTDFASVKPLRTIAVLLLVASLGVGWFVPEAGACLGTLGFYALVLYAGVVGYGNAAATIHDHLYRWMGVRLGGWWSFQRSK